MDEGEEKLPFSLDWKSGTRFVCVLGGGLLQHDVSLNTVCHLSNVAMSTQFVTHDDSDKTCNHCTFFPSRMKRVMCDKCC